MLKPTVSVVIPTYNRSVTVRQAIRSAFSQSMAPLEVIVVDDGSTDSTQAVVAREQEYWGQTLRLLTQEHGERSIARNRGIGAAQGDYIAFLDSDDLWRSNHLETSLNVLGQGPKRSPPSPITACSPMMAASFATTCFARPRTGVPIAIIRSSATTMHSVARWCGKTSSCTRVRLSCRDMHCYQPAALTSG